MLLNRGVDPYTNRTMVPLLTFEEMTTARNIISGRPLSRLDSIAGYGMAWMRSSYQGHDVGSPSFRSE